MQNLYLNMRIYYKMKQTKMKVTIIFLFVMAFGGLNAQTALTIKEKTGTQTSFALKEVNKLTFNSGNIIVTKKNGNNNGFAISKVQFLNFTNLTAIDPVSKGQFGSMLLYPNPVRDILQIRYESSNEEKVRIEIINVQGQVIAQQNEICQAGSNYYSIPFYTFQNGIYLCRIHNGSNTEIAKFIKY